MIIYCEPDPDRPYPGAAEVLRVTGSVDDLSAAVPADGQLVVLGAGVPLAEAVAFAAEQRLHRPTLGVLLLRERIEVQVLTEAIRAGIREVVAVDQPAALDSACERALELSRQLGAARHPDIPGAPAPAPAQAQIVTVFAGKGGVGKSTIASNLAVSLADDGRRRVCLIDLDLQFGDVALLLQLNPDRSIADAIPMAGRLDQAAVQSLITTYRPGVDALLAPTVPGDGDRVTRDLVVELLDVARSMYDYIVVDTPPYVGDQVLATFDRTDWFVLVVTPDLPALKSMRLTLNMFELLEYPTQRRLMVLNRADSDVGITVADVEKTLGQPATVRLPSSRDVPLSVNRGTPLAVQRPSHPFATAIRGLAERCGAGGTEGGRRTGRRFWWGR